MEIIIVFFVITVTMLITTCVIMYKKLERYETWTLDIRKEIYKIFNTINIIDNKQMFEKDDDVGKLWEAIKDTVEKIDDFVIPDGIVEENEEDDNELIIE